MSEPTEYNELVELIESNDPGTATQVIQETHTPNDDLRELIDKWRSDALYATGNTATVYEICAEELEELIDE